MSLQLNCKPKHKVHNNVFNTYITKNFIWYLRILDTFSGDNLRTNQVPERVFPFVFTNDLILFIYQQLVSFVIYLVTVIYSVIL